MKSNVLLIMGLAMTVALSAQAQDDDDLYFVPAKKKAKTERVEVTPVRQSTPAKRPELAVYNNNSRDDDEYNRRAGSYGGSWQTGSMGESEDSLMAEVESVDTRSAEDIYDPELDFYYSRRLLRFHSPRFGFALSSPHYWSLVYGYGVYDYLYDPFYYDFYDPFYWNYGWGYGWSYSSWYGPLYGWHSPYIWDTWGYGPMWHHHHYYGSGSSHLAYHSASYNRGRLAQSSFGAGNRGGVIQRTSAVASANGSRNVFSSRNANAVRVSANNNPTTNVSRPANVVNPDRSNRVQVFNGQVVNNGTVGGTRNSIAQQRVGNTTVNRTQAAQQVFNGQRIQATQQTQRTQATQQPQRTQTTQQQQRTQQPVQQPQRTQQTQQPVFNAPQRNTATSTFGGGGGGGRVTTGGGGGGVGRR